jgi:Tol biopolymer transport system component
VGEPANYLNLSLAPNDTLLAIAVTNERSETRNVWIQNLAGGTPRQATFSTASDFTPAWSPDGQSIVFSSDRDGNFDLYRTEVSGGSDSTVVLPSRDTKLARHWSRDGFITFDALNDSGKVHVWTMRATESVAEQLTQGASDQWFGRFSPDGRWIAYVSNQFGQYDVFVARFPKSQGFWKVSTGGGFQPIWNPTGGELFYLAPDGKLMVAAFTATETAFSPSTPHPLFQTRVNVATVNPPESLNHYDVSADGNRFLIASRAASSSVPIVRVFDWRAGVKR